jgi:hypothetical protein
MVPPSPGWPKSGSYCRPCRDVVRSARSPCWVRAFLGANRLRLEIPVSEGEPIIPPAARSSINTVNAAARNHWYVRSRGMPKVATLNVTGLQGAWLQAGVLVQLFAWWSGRWRSYQGPASPLQVPWVWCPLQALPAPGCSGLRRRPGSRSALPANRAHRALYRTDITPLGNVGRRDGGTAAPLGNRPEPGRWAPTASLGQAAELGRDQPVFRVLGTAEVGEGINNTSQAGQNVFERHVERVGVAVHVGVPPCSPERVASGAANYAGGHQQAHVQKIALPTAHSAARSGKRRRQPCRVLQRQRLRPAIPVLSPKR